MADADAPVVRGWREARDAAGVTVTWTPTWNQRVLGGVLLLVWTPALALFAPAFARHPTALGAVGLGMLVLAQYFLWSLVLDVVVVRVEPGLVAFGRRPLPLRPTRRLATATALQFDVTRYKSNFIVVLRDARHRAHDVGMYFKREDAGRAAARLETLLVESRRPGA